MKPGEIESWWRAEPFVPFRVRTSDARCFEIRHPGAIIVSRRNVAIAIKRSRSRIPDSIAIHPLAAIERVEGVSRTARHSTCSLRLFW